MKIAFFVTEFPTLSETFIINQIMALRNSGNLVHIFSQQSPVDQTGHQNIKDTRLRDMTFYLDGAPNSRGRKVISLIGKTVSNLFKNNNKTILRAIFNNRSSLSVYDFSFFIDKPSYDILHAHFGLNGNYVTQLRKLGLYPNARFITSFHGYDLNTIFAGSGFYDALFKSCDVFTVNSNFSKKCLVQLGCSENTITILPVGLNIEYFRRKSPLKIAKTKICLLFVGRLIRLKGPDLFVKICNELRLRGKLLFEAIIIGNGSMYKEISQLIREHQLETVVSLTGPASQEKIVEIMSEADIFLLPGIVSDGSAETQGLVIQEAQAMHLPVIVSDAGGMSEGMIDGITGFVVPENDLERFVEKIELLANDIDRRLQMGEAGRKFVEVKYNIDNLNKLLIDVYQNNK